MTKLYPIGYNYIDNDCDGDRTKENVL